IRWLFLLYNSALGLIDKDHARVHNGQALTLLLARQWLEKNGYEIQLMDLNAARAVVNDYSCDQSIFDELQRMCLEYGDQKHLKKGESLTQGIARRFNTVAPATWRARPQVQTKNIVVDNVATPRPSLDSMRNKSGLTV
ncbi:hypothetical protein, partial [Endozoicomonas sp.]|uniref:hypothetical protein n=1 Tax=Endozoicomonas sp. TaxID=1892382 RepID=UPI00383B4D4A